MKTLIKITLALLGIGALAVFGLSWAQRGATGHQHSEPKQLYTCGMHPQVIQDKPGDCPICGMTLQPIRKQPAETSGEAGRKVQYYKSTMLPGEVSDTPGKDSMGMDMVPVYETEEAGTSTISIDPVTIQNMGVRTGLVTQGPLRRTIRTVGVIDYDETKLSDVTTKFRGWIEKLFVDATGLEVKKGDPLFEAYSPEIYNAEQEYLVLSRNKNPELARTTLERMELLDVPADVLGALKASGKAERTIPIRAAADGVVLEKSAVEGMMFEPGATLYKLADLSDVWVQAQVYEQDLPFVRLGQEATATLSYLPGQKFKGRVAYIYPTLNSKTRTAQVRLEFANPDRLLKPGMFATVEIESVLKPNAILVPDMAVLRSGERNTVFVALDGGKFDPREVTIGQRDSDGNDEVLQGLAAGEKVVTSAQFLLDSESQLREAIQKMQEPAPLDTNPSPLASPHDAAHMKH